MEADSERAEVRYPSVHAGAERTEVVFHGGVADVRRAYPEESGKRRIFVTDETVAALPAVAPFLSSFSGGSGARPLRRGGDVAVVLGAGERHKTIGSVLEIVRAALDADAPRTAVFVGIGGGVVTDMTAFAASIFKRGAKCELVPTTLLSMVDAAVGGKTGCDFDSYKNMVGSFFPARTIHVFPQFVGSLPFCEWRSGLAEVVKTALLYSPGLFGRLESGPSILENRDDPLVGEAIRACVRAKGAVVERDFTEKGERMHLNLGHTFGHALETCAGLGAVTHGDGVAWGIARAAELSARLGLAQAGYEGRVKAALAKFGWEVGASHPAMAGKGGAAALFAAMRKDKKNSGAGVRFVLQRDVGDTTVREVAEADVMAVLE